MSGAVDVSRSGRAQCPYAFGLRACVPATLVSVWSGTSLTQDAIFQSARRRGRVPQQPGPLCLHLLSAYSVIWHVYQAGASAAGDSHTAATTIGHHRHTRAHIIFFQTQIPVSGVLQCWILALHVPMFRVQGRAVWSRANRKHKLRMATFVLPGERGGGGGRGSNVSDGYSDSDSVSA